MKDFSKQLKLNFVSATATTPLTTPDDSQLVFQVIRPVPLDRAPLVIVRFSPTFC